MTRPAPRTTRKISTRWLLALFFVACQADTDEVPPLELERCSAKDSPRELLRIEDAREYRPYDVIDGVTAIPETGEFGGGLLVDNCGGEPVGLEDSYGLLAGAAYVDRQVVLCSPRGAVTASDSGIWEVLETGARGRALGVGNQCAHGYPSSFGFVHTDDGLVQHLPDGSTRTVPPLSRPTLTWFGDAGLVRSPDGGLVVLPPGGAEAIVVEGVPQIDLVVTQGTASTWVFLAAYSEPFDLTQLGFPFLYALDLASGAWFEIGEVTGDDLRSRNFVSADDGLVATVDGTLRFYRASWGGSATTDLDGARGVSVIDAERVVVATAAGVQLVRVPLERPEDDEPLTLEVVWSRPLEEGEPGRTSAGVPWKDVILVDGTENVWAYPLDGSDPSPLLPSLGFTESTFPSLGYTHLGEEFVTAMARNPSDPEDFWLFRNRIGGELEVLDTDIQGAPPLDSLGFITMESYRWTPQLGRILYAVRDGNGVSIRQHVLAD